MTAEHDFRWHVRPMHSIHMFLVSAAAPPRARVSPTEMAKARMLYRVLEKLIQHPQAKQLLTHASGKKVREARRLILARFDPASCSADAACALALGNPKNWTIKKI